MVPVYEAANALAEFDEKRADSIMEKALEGIAAIYEIQGDYRKAADTKMRLLELLTKEWGFSEETVVHETEREIERLMEPSVHKITAANTTANRSSTLLFFSSHPN